MGEGLFGVQPRGALQRLRGSRRNAPRSRCRAPDGLASRASVARCSAHGQIVPAFAPGRGDIAGAVPEGADVIGGFCLDPGMAAQFPGAEIHLSQGRDHAAGAGAGLATHRRWQRRAPDRTRRSARLAADRPTAGRLRRCRTDRRAGRTSRPWFWHGSGRGAPN